MDAIQKGKNARRENAWRENAWRENARRENAWRHRRENAWRHQRILKVQTVVPSVHFTARHDLLPETRVADFL